MVKRLYAWSPVVFNAVVVALVAVANEILKKYVSGFPEIDAAVVMAVLGVPAVGASFASVTPTVGKPKE